MKEAEPQICLGSQHLVFLQKLSFWQSVTDAKDQIPVAWQANNVGIRRSNAVPCIFPCDHDTVH